MEQTPEKAPSGHQEQGAADDMVARFMRVAQGPDGDLLLNLLDVLYDRMTESDYDDQHLSTEDLEAIRQGQEDLKQGRSLTLEEYRSGKRL
ncbi:MAG: hypothetical protein NTY36_10160 [Deltaproteobacteria bacterium]|nr:hypothetical protein [Deltaproteobacteria bacterium]